MNLLKTMSRKSWGVSRKLLLRFYQIYVRSIMDSDAQSTALQKHRLSRSWTQSKTQQYVSAQALLPQALFGISTPTQLY